MSRPFDTIPLIRHPDVDPKAFSIQYFRREFETSATVDEAVVWVSACQRFELWIDDVLIGRGPSQSDPSRWHVSPISVTNLPAGRHLCAVRVVNRADYAGIVQLGTEAFLLVAPEDDRLSGLTSGEHWIVRIDTATTPTPDPVWHGPTPYFVAGAGDRVLLRDLPAGWRLPQFDSSSWAQAKEIAPQWDNPWGRYPADVILRPDPLPQMTDEPLSWARTIPEATTPMKITRGSRVVWDAGELVNAWPVIRLKGPVGAVVRLVWSEAPYTREGSKRHRDETEDAFFCGPYDEFVLSGEEKEVTTTWYRSFRYVEITVQSANGEVYLHEIALSRTSFPLAKPERPTEIPTWVSEADAANLWEASWLTIRNCAHEVIMDCPHYEQAQFPGDSRIQAIYHYTLCDERRLGLKAIDDLHASRMHDGIVQCRFPSRQVQIIPTFGIYWIMMIEDYLRFGGPREDVEPYSTAVLGVVQWFERLLGPSGLLGRVPHAPFIDWSPAFRAGNAPQEPNGESSILTLLFSRGLRSASRIFAVMGEPPGLIALDSLADSLVEAVVRTCWDKHAGWFRDTVSGPTFSQHAQIEAVLAGAVRGEDARDLMSRALNSATLGGIGTLYYRFYQVEALMRCGLSESMPQVLSSWTKTLRREGLTTFPETELPNPRSDNHAWAITPALAIATVRWWD